MSTLDSSGKCTTPSDFLWCDLGAAALLDVRSSLDDCSRLERFISSANTRFARFMSTVLRIAERSVRLAVNALEAFPLVLLSCETSAAQAPRGSAGAAPPRWVCDDPFSAAAAISGEWRVLLVPSHQPAAMGFHHFVSGLVKRIF